VRAATARHLFRLRACAVIAPVLVGVARPMPARADDSLRFSGYVQLDWTAYNQTSSDEVGHSSDLPLNRDRFTLKRGRLRLDAERHLFDAALEIDANTVNGPVVRPVAAEIGARWPKQPEKHAPSLRVSAGLMKIPFGFEVPERDAERPFLERSTLMRALFPGQYDLGAALKARYRFLTLSVAVMNGSPLGDHQFPALAPTRSKDFVGRLATRSELGSALDFELGVSAESGRGFHEGTPTTKDELAWRDDNGDGIVQATEVQVIPGSAATASETFPRFALGADARLELRLPVLGVLGVRFELARAQNLDRGVEPADPVGSGYDFREFGYYLGVTQELTRWVLVGARYDRYNPDQDASERIATRLVPVDRSYATLALIAMFRYDIARLTLEYDRNDNALGRTASGAPTTLKSDAVTLRGQVAF
jgi:hypothetical protein